MKGKWNTQEIQINAHKSFMRKTLGDQEVQKSELYLCSDWNNIYGMPQVKPIFKIYYCVSLSYDDKDTQ